MTIALAASAGKIDDGSTEGSRAWYTVLFLHFQCYRSTEAMSHDPIHWLSRVLYLMVCGVSFFVALAVLYSAEGYLTDIVPDASASLSPFNV